MSIERLVKFCFEFEEEELECVETAMELDNTTDKGRLIEPR